VVGAAAIVVQAAVDAGQAGAEMAADHTFTDPAFEDHS
jgi:hypothetical protein